LYYFGMFTEIELKAVADFSQQIEKRASWVNPMAYNGYTLNMPPIKPWEAPAPTLSDAFRGMLTGLGGLAGTTAQTVLTGRNNPGVMENYLNHGIKLLSHPTDPARFRDFISTKNLTEPFLRARPEYNQAFRQIGEPGAMIGPELGERYRILKGVFNNPGGHF
jgi:hypothetical protein